MVGEIKDTFTQSVIRDLSKIISFTVYSMVETGDILLQYG